MSLSARQLVVLCAAVFSTHQMASAQFSPTNYQIYQLDQATSTTITPMKSGGAAASNALTFGSDITVNTADTSAWTMGPGWLVPNGDNPPKALRTTQANGMQLTYGNPAPNTPVQTYGFSFKIVKVDTTVLLGTCMTFDMYQQLPTGALGFAHSAGLGLFLTAHAGMIVSTLQDSATDRVDTVKTRNDTLKYNFQPGQWYQVKFECDQNSRGEELMSLIVGDSTLLTSQTTVNRNTHFSISQNSGIVTIGGGTYGYYQNDLVTSSKSSTTEIDFAEFNFFDGISGKDLFAKYGHWEADPTPGTTDTLAFPSLITQVLYDPPGNGSSASLSSGQTITNASEFKVGATVGATVFFGAEVPAEVWSGECGFDLQVTGGVKVSYEYATSVSASYSTSSQLQSSVDGCMTKYIGPGRGDLVGYFPAKVQRKLYRRPKLNVLVPASDNDYTYFLASQILPDPSAKISYTTITNLLDICKSDTANLNYIQQELAVDVKTHRVRTELIGNRLVPCPNLDLSFAGGLPTTKSSQLTSSSSVTHTLSGSLTADVQAKLIISCVKVGGSLSFEATMGGSEATANEDTRSASYTLFDNEGWDTYKITTYYDTRFGVYVFDVDSASSYSSWPYEDGYSKKAVDWQIVSADTVESGNAGEVLNYGITLKNTTPSIGGAPSQLTFNAEVVNYPDQASVYPTEVKINRNSNGTFTASLSSPAACTTHCVLRISVSDPNAASSCEPMIQDIPLTARFTPATSGIYASCKKSTVSVPPGSNPANYTFQILLQNVGVTAATIDVGVDSVSNGVTYQLGTIANNPVPAGDSAHLSLAVTGSGNTFPYTVSVWAKVHNDPVLHKLTLVINDTGLVAVVPRALSVRNRPLEIASVTRNGISVYAPGSLSATIQVFNVLGKRILFRQGIHGQVQLPMNGANGTMVIIFEQGNTKLRRKAVVN